MTALCFLYSWVYDIARHAQFLQPATAVHLSRAMSYVTIGALRSNDADDNENVKKTIGLISKTTISNVHHTFCTFLSRFNTTTT